MGDAEHLLYDLRQFLCDICEIVHAQFHIGIIGTMYFRRHEHIAHFLGETLRFTVAQPRVGVLLEPVEQIERLMIGFPCFSALLLLKRDDNLDRRIHMSEQRKKPQLNMRYYNGEIDDDLPYVGELHYDEETGLIYDEDGDVVDEKTLDAMLDGDGKGDDEDE